MILNQILRHTSQILLALFLILVGFDFNSHEFQFKLTLHIRLSSLKPTRASIKQKNTGTNSMKGIYSGQLF